MKPDEATINSECGDSDQVTGDVIGDTAYSERFVLKILLKLANLDTLKEEINEKSFEDDLCTLWDMTAERDVVLFLQKHNILNLINFALPVIESTRMIEIIVGVIGNICCQKEAVAELLQMESFVTVILGNIKSDDSLVLIQVLRFINSSLFLSDDESIAVWLGLFEANEYSSALYFILKNSSHKVLLVTALENLNTICSCCNIEKIRKNFFDHFVTVEAIESLSVALSEITANHADAHEDEKDVLERTLVISLQIMLNLLGFDKSIEVYSDSKNDISKTISGVLTYYENKLVAQKETDTDLVDVIESTNTILKTMNIVCEPHVYFNQAYSIWQAIKTMKENHNQSDFEEDDRKDINEFSEQINQPLSMLICLYLKSCSDDAVIKAVTVLDADYDTILSEVENEELTSCVSIRTANYRTRLKDNVDS